MTGTARQTRGGTGELDPPLRYTLPAPAGAVWLGLRPGALAGLGVTVAGTLLVLLSGAPVPLALLVLLLGAAASSWPVAGRTPLSWLPRLLAHTLARATGTVGWSAPLPARAPEPSRVDGVVTGGRAPARRPARQPRMGVRVPLPPECGRLRVLELTGDTDPAVGAPIAGLYDADRGTIAVVLAVTGTDRFTLLDPADQDSQLARWGTCLAALHADPRLQHLQWLTCTRPDTTRDAGRPHPTHRTSPGSHHRSPATPGTPADPVDPAGLDYLALVDSARAAALTHQHLLVLTLPAPPLTAAPSSRVRAAVSGRRAGAVPADRQPFGALVEQVREVSGTLLTADLLPRPLGASELGDVVRRLTDPALPADPAGSLDPDQNAGPDQNASQDQPSGDGGGRPAARWGVLSRRHGWTSCWTDDTAHRTFAVTGWPRLPMPADWLSVLLHTAPPPGTARTVSVHATAVAAQHAARRARAAAAKARLDAGDRNRLGFTPAATDTLAEADATQLEAELVAGYRLAEVTALVTVSAPDLIGLETAAQNLRTAAVSARLDLRGLHGQHHLALAGCLPLGRLPGGNRR